MDKEINKEELYNQLDFVPREVTLGAKICLLFGRVSGYIGWGLLIFGSIMFWMFIANADYLSLYFWLNKKDILLTNGEVLEIFPTGFSSGSKHNKRTIYGIRYEFKLNGKRYINTSYTEYCFFKVGDKVKVEYIKNKPKISRIKGTRTNIFPIFICLFIIMPIFAIIFILISFYNGKRDIYLLTFGRVAKAKVLSKKRTNLRINHKYVYKVTFSYEAEEDNKEYKKDIKTEKIEGLSENDNIILYDEMKPNKSFLFINLPSSIYFKEGVFYVKSIKYIILAITFPILAILLNIFLVIFTRKI